MACRDLAKRRAYKAAWMRRKRAAAPRQRVLRATRPTPRLARVLPGPLAAPTDEILASLQRETGSLRTEITMLSAEVSRLRRRVEPPQDVAPMAEEEQAEAGGETESLLGIDDGDF